MLTKSLLNSINTNLNSSMSKRLYNKIKRFLKQSHREHRRVIGKWDLIKLALYRRKIYSDNDYYCKLKGKYPLNKYVADAVENYIDAKRGEYK
jgi:hypothetical protein